MSKISELSDGGSLVSSDYLIAVRSGGNVKVRMDQINVDQVDLGDNEFIRLGNSQDLTMVHTSTQSIINQAGIGDLLIQKAGATKLTINATGIDVTGSVTADAATFSGAVTIDANVDDQLTLSRAAGNNRILKYETAGVARWAVYADGVAEAGSDAGSDYQISYYNDAGVYQGNALTLTRATGAATFSGTVTADGLTVDGAADINGDLEVGSAGAGTKAIVIAGSGSSTSVMDLKMFGGGTGNPTSILRHSSATKDFSILTGNSGAELTRLLVTEGGDLSLYEDTGTTPKFFWDSSAENITINHEASSLNGLAIKNTTSSGVTTGAGLTLHAYDGSSTSQMGGMFVSNSTWSYGTYSPNQLNIVGSGSGGVRVATVAAPITFHTGNANAGLSAERMRIDASGNLLVGKDTTGLADAGFEVQSSGQITANQANAPAAKFNRLTNDGEIIRLHKDGTTVGSISSHTGGFLKIDTAGDSSGLLFGTSAIYPIKNDVIDDDAVDLGDGSNRFKDLYLSGGVVFGATGGAVTSKTLDDYEEGTWTPTLEGAVSAGSYSVAIEDSSCKYTKVGRQVTVTGRFTFTVASAGSSYAKIGGLPFATSATNAMAGAVRTKGIGLAAGTVSLCTLNPTSGSVSYFAIGQSIDNANSVLLDIAGISSTDQITVTLTYFV